MNLAQRWRNESANLRALMRGPSWRDRLWLARFIVRSRLDARFGARLARRFAPAGPEEAERAAGQLPRTIWIYWAQGWDDAPDLVKLCRQSWERMNPGWEVIALDDAGAEARTGMISYMQGRDVPGASIGNMVRFALLARFGGVWADATTLCARPLDDWLPPLMGSGFFAFSGMTPDRVQETWFLASTPGHHVPAAWLRDSKRYWRDMREVHLYFWCSHIFTQLCRDDPAFGEAWARTPQVDPWPLLELHHHHWHAPDFARRLDQYDARGVPMFKLNWRQPLDQRTGVPLREFVAKKAGQVAAR